MKRLKRAAGLWLAVLCGMVYAVTAHAAGEPGIILKASGMEGQYILRLENFSSRFESVQFDIVVDGQVSAPRVTWMDDSPDHFQRIDTGYREGKTVLTVYVDRLSPIAGSGSVELAALTFAQTVPASSFSSGDTMKALDGHQEETVFASPSLTVTGSAGDDTGTAGNGSAPVKGSSDSGKDDDSETDSGSFRVLKSGRVLHWDDVSEDAGGKELTVSVSAGQTIGRDVFTRAAERGLLLRLDYGDYIWTFDTGEGVDIPAGRLYYDLSIGKLAYRNLSVAVDESDIAQFEIAYSGPLPCPATLSYRVGDAYAGETVYLSYYNESGASLEYRGEAEASSGGMADYAFTHASKYVISTENLWGTPEKEALPEGDGSAPPAAGGEGIPAAGGETGTVRVPPADEVEEMDALEKAVAEEEALSSSSAPEEDIPAGTEPEKETPGRREGWILPVMIAALLATVAATLLIHMHSRPAAAASRRRKRRR